MDSRTQYNNLISNHWITPLDQGRFIMHEKFLEVMNLFDDIILHWAKKDQAERFGYSDFISIDKINQCDYINQFHNTCYFVGTSESDAYDIRDIHPTTYINNPSMCMHSYIQLEGKLIHSPVVLTMKGKCKRKEIKPYENLSRLMDFTMREIVFIGSEPYVLKKRKEYMELANRLTDDLILVGNIKIANDPFFKKDSEARVDFQKKFKLKYEFNLLNMDDKKEVAVGSFNYHGMHFSTAFNIRLANHEYAFTVCIAYGLERLAYLFITQKGLEKSTEILKNYIRQNI